MKTHPEDDVSKMLDAYHVMDDRRNQLPLSAAMRLEKAYLIELGSSLGRCAEKLVALALQDSKRMVSLAASTSGANANGMMQDEWAYFFSAMVPALDHTQIETKVSKLNCIWRCLFPMICFLPSSRCSVCLEGSWICFWRRCGVEQSIGTISPSRDGGDERVDSFVAIPVQRSRRHNEDEESCKIK